MQWTKHGRFFALSDAGDLRRSHTQLPVVDTHHPGCWRLYYSSRDAENRSHPFYIELAPANPDELIAESVQPLLGLGEAGSFDEHGVMPTAVRHSGAQIFLYYIGWSRRTDVPYCNAIGLAISDDAGRSFHRYAHNPLFAQNHVDPLFTGTLDIQNVDGMLHGYYMSCTQWLRDGDALEPRYHIKLATSRDGIAWSRDGRVAIDYRDAQEGGLVSASTLRLGGCYAMWYACRKASGFREIHANTYRIGYAESQDGLHWRRRDHLAGIAPSDSGWDSEMICYPCVVRHADRLFMFYNGNGFGSSGIGYATRDVQAS
jgi:hypothetical protein